MSINKMNPQEFIQQTFPPMIAVMTTAGVEMACRKNNLSFVEMIRPFSKATIDGSLKDGSGTSIPIKNLRVCFTDIDSRPPPLPVARSYFNEVINSNMQDRTSEVIIGEDKLDVPVTVPWFEAWRSTFLQVQYPSDHEFTKHYLACLIVVSSEEEKPIEKVKVMMTKVNEYVQYGASKLPKWYTPPSFVLTCCLLLHDNAAGESLPYLPLTIEELKSIYGSDKCFVLNINSYSQTKFDNLSQIPDPWSQFLLTNITYKEEIKDPDMQNGVELAHELEEKMSPSTPFIAHPLSPMSDDRSVSSYDSENTYSEKSSLNTQHGKLLTAEDINGIKQFVNDFCLKALLPHIEQCIINLSDQISNKKGMSRSLFSATKRWFGTNKPGVPSNHISPTAIAYSSDSHELQLRRLGDLAFMAGHYLLAYNAYHGAKRDFSGDGAWLHYAGALEMAALSAFMFGNEGLARKVIDYAEESITTYQTSCRVNQFATRATLLSVECLKGRGLYGEAAKQLIRMSGEDSDLRSAVLLEQAAYAFLQTRKPLMHRKYAFHMVLAGHRYNKAGHKNHSMRCYYQAYQVYHNKTWSIAEDHILFTIGKQASQLKLTTNAIDALSYLVKRTSRQNAQQQSVYLQEYITTIKEYQETDVTKLPLPVIDSQTVHILLNMSTYRPPSCNMVPASSTAYDYLLPKRHCHEKSVWWKLEEKLLNHIDSSLNVMIFKPTVEILTNRTNNSKLATIVIGEPVGICLNFRNPLHIKISISGLHLMWFMQSKDNESSEDDTTAIADIVPDFILEPDSDKNIILTVRPMVVGKFKVTGIKYSFGDSDWINFVTGMQPLVIKSRGSRSRQDTRLQFLVIDNMPRLQICFSGLRRDIFSSEIVPVNVHFENTGDINISRIFVIIGSAFSFWIDGSIAKTATDVLQIPLNGSLLPGQKITVPVLLYPHFKDTTECLELLFYYDSDDERALRHRLIRHSWPTTSHNLFKITTLTSRSHCLLSKEETINIKMHIAINTTDIAPSPLFKLHIDCISLHCLHWKFTNKSFTPKEFVVTKEESVYVLLQSVKEQNPTDSLSTVNFTSERGLPLEFCLPKLENKDISDENNVYYVINWKTGISDEYGIHSVYGQEDSMIRFYEVTQRFPAFIFGTARLLGTQLIESSLQKLVSYQLENPSFVNHDFFEMGLCTLPVYLWLHNSAEVDIVVKVELITIPKDTPEAVNAPECFTWIGKTEFKEVLKGLERKRVLLQPAFTSHGSYDLTSRIVVFVYVNDEMIIQTCKLQASVIIN